jgi:hypothetical protein
MTSHDVAHREKDSEQDHDDEKSAEQLAIAQHKLEVAFVVPRHMRMMTPNW